MLRLAFSPELIRRNALDELRNVGYKEHLIVVGGPINNSCTAAILNELKDASFQDFDLCLSDGTRYSTAYDDKDRPTRDYGAVIRLDNPFDHSRDVVLAVGCDTYGVLAAAMLVSSRPDAKAARQLLHRHIGVRKYLRRQAFLAVVEAPVLGTDIGPVSLKHFRRLTR